jgi:hypothetical protein
MNQRFLAIPPTVRTPGLRAEPAFSGHESSALLRSPQRTVDLLLNSTQFAGTASADRNTLPHCSSALYLRFTYVSMAVHPYF